MSHLPTLGACSSLHPLASPLDCAATNREAKAAKATLAQQDSSACAILIQGAGVDVVDAHTGHRVAAWTFTKKKGESEAAPESDAIITCEAHSGSLVAVGLNTGYVAVLDIRGSRLRRYIHVGPRVTALAVVEQGRAMTEEVISAQLSSSFNRYCPIS